ncbi:MAG: SusC/RagA family TonB-linked outer membrane protein [Flavobacteriaceae bacterium]
MSTAVWAQTISGTVTDENNQPLPGATVVVQGTNTGTTTDFDGNYQIRATQGQTLVFSYVGYATQNVMVNSTTHNVSLQADNKLDEVVVTALGITRAEKSLGYAVQTVSGESVEDVRSVNPIEALQGEVAGLDVQAFNTMGGSANVVIRGYSSLSGSNQALFVVDGTPIDNETGNSLDAVTGRGGVDFGNAAMDINPSDIASVSVLKGAAASALYGSRGANGVVLITTKKGKSKEGIGITVNSQITAGYVDKSTLPVYQNQYGYGYGQFRRAYIGPSSITAGEQWTGNYYGQWGDNSAFYTGDDGSYGPKLVGQEVHHWFNMVPEWTDLYQKTAPAVAPNDTPNDFFETDISQQNSISFEDAGENGTFRLSYTNVDTKGILPNSFIDRNSASLRATRQFGDLNIDGSISYVNTQTTGRFGTGYDGLNPMQGFRQWWAVGASILEQKRVFEETGKNYSWNMIGTNTDDASDSPNHQPLYFDNPYWSRYNNYTTDSRNRYFGNISLTYDVNENLNVLGRVTYDNVTEVREQRANIAVGTGSKGANLFDDQPGYQLENRIRSEYNYDIVLSYNKNISEDFDVNALAGFNLRVQNWDESRAKTNGGLNFPDIFSLTNSANPITADDLYQYDAQKKVDGLYGSLNFGFKDTYYVEGIYRRDRSSALPVDNNTYGYYSVSGSVLLSNLIQSEDLTFAKLRASYAVVGNDTAPYNVYRAYFINAARSGAASASNPSTLPNKDLKAETTSESEVGLELNFFNGRLGFDLALYDKTTNHLLTDLDVSPATGFSAIVTNAGSIQNKGLEALLKVTPVVNDNFRWNMTLNYNTFKSEILSLGNDATGKAVQYLNLMSPQGGVQIGGQVGEPFGVIRGHAHVRDANGAKVLNVRTSGSGASAYQYAHYLRTSNSDNVIGDINPDWTGSIRNSFTYKNFDLSFLIDIQQGGDFFSLDTWYGYGTGVLDRSVGTNHLGNDIRLTIPNGGGKLLDGVILPSTAVITDGVADVAGTQNTTVMSRYDYYANPEGWTSIGATHEMHVHDASFVKLRELKLGYNFPSSLIGNSPFTSASIAFVGRNLWIIHKNAPYTDPESGIGAGNRQGYQSGAYPAVKTYGLNLKFTF